MSELVLIGHIDESGFNAIRQATLDGLFESEII